MDKDKVSKYLKICKKYNYEQIVKENVELQDEKDIIIYIKLLGKLENIYNKYHDMKFGGASGSKGAKSKHKPNKNDTDTDTDTDNESHNNRQQNNNIKYNKYYTGNQSHNIINDKLKVAGIASVGTSLYNLQNPQLVQQSSQVISIDFIKKQIDKLKLEIINEIHTDLTLPQSVLSILVDNRINKIVKKHQ